MTRQPFSFIRPVPKSRPNRWEGERFLASDLAMHLRVTTAEVAIYARRRRIARFMRITHQTCDEREVVWVTRTGARQVIEHFRAKQGAVYQSGKDWVVERAKRTAYGLRKRERQKAEREQERALGGLARLIGGPVSGAQLAEGEPDGVSGG
jgi:hypothetical protein